MLNFAQHGTRFRLICQRNQTLTKTFSLIQTGINLVNYLVTLE